MPNRAELLKQQLLQSLALPWQDLLPSSRVEAILAQAQIAYRNSVYSPVVTLWAMISQALDPDKSLRNVVKRVISWLSAAGASCPSCDTGAYSKARNRLPETLLEQLVPEVGEALEQQVPIEQQWCGRRVRVYDGTTVLMSDTPANQAAYEQPKTQRAGCGFPIANVVVVFSLLSGAVVAGCIAAHTCSEIVMSRLLYQRLDPEDVVLADRAYGNYVDLALVQQQRADGVFRKNQARHSDFRRGKRLGVGDHLGVWRKPKMRPKHMSVADFAQLPANLEVREVAFCVTRQGFRTQKLVVVTPLLDAKRYSVAQLSHLYRWRWQAAEVNLRHLKTSLKLEMVNAKTPEMVRKEIWAHLLGYTLLRTLMWQSATPRKHTPFQLSFQGARAQFNQMLSLLATGANATRKRLYQLLLEQIVTDLLPIRAHRSEPRVVKRRPKPFPKMQQPRSVLKAKLVK